eukprot:1372755-Rhodomonas_salina.1
MAYVEGVTKVAFSDDDLARRVSLHHRTSADVSLCRRGNLLPWPEDRETKRERICKLVNCSVFPPDGMIEWTGLRGFSETLPSCRFPSGPGPRK